MVIFHSKLLVYRRVQWIFQQGFNQPPPIRWSPNTSIEGRLRGLNPNGTSIEDVRLGSLALTTPGVNQHWVILVHAPMKCLIQVTGLSSPRNRCGSWTFLGKPGKTRLFITIVPTKVAVCHLGGTNYVQTQGQLAVSSPIQKGPSQDYHQLSMNQTIQNEDENMNIHLHPIQNQDFSVLCKSQMEWTSALWKRG